jgi:hypothetical protein
MNPRKGRVTLAIQTLVVRRCVISAPAEAIDYMQTTDGWGTSWGRLIADPSHPITVAGMSHDIHVPPFVPVTNR